MASEQDRPDGPQARAQFRQEVAGIASEDWVFLDESGVTTSLTRRYGRAPRGQRVVARVPQGRWQVLTILGAIPMQGILVARTMPSATAGDVFRS